MEENIIIIQRCFRFKQSLKTFLSLKLYEFPPSFEYIQNKILLKNTRLITYNFLNALFNFSSIKYGSTKNVSQQVKHILSLYLLHHYPDILIDSQIHNESEQNLLSQVHILIKHIHKCSIYNNVTGVNTLVNMINEYFDKFSKWLEFDKQNQLQIFSELICQLRNRESSTENDEIKAEYKKCCKAFENKIFSCVEKLAGKQGVQYVNQYLDSVEKIKEHIVEKLHSSVQTTMQKVFWDSVSLQLKSEKHKNTSILLVFGDIKEKILNIIKTNDKFREEIENGFDMSLYEMKCINGSFDVKCVTSLFQHTMSVLKKICTPSQDKIINDIEEEVHLLLTGFENFDNISEIVPFFINIFQHLDYIERQLESISSACSVPIKE